MPFQTTTHFVAKAIPGPGQRLVHGRLVGPTDETYPPGTGGPLPRKDNINYQVTKIVTVKDLNSGHTRTARTAYISTGDAASDAAAARAKTAPGQSITLGRPVTSDTDPGDPAATSESLEQVEAKASRQNPLDPQEQAMMDQHFLTLSGPDRLIFQAAYPHYEPSASVKATADKEASKELPSEEASAASTQTQAPAAKSASGNVGKPFVSKGATTSKQLG